jgi:Glycosyl transferase family 11
MDIVIASKYGRIGNRLFLHGHALACAIANGVRLYNPCMDEYAHYFRTIAGDPLCRYPSDFEGVPVTDKVTARRQSYVKALERLSRRLPTRGPLQVLSAPDENHEFRLDHPLFKQRLRGPGYVLLNGYHFLDYVNLERHRPEIAAHFHLVDRHADNVGACLASAREGDPILVGVHMRRGDYRTWKKGRFFFDDEQYARIFAQIEALHAPRAVRFLIASDEVIQLENFARFDCKKSTGHIIEDIYCLAGCDVITGPFSTYSSWASFYGNKKVYFIKMPDKEICPSDFNTHWEVSQATMALG